eukprot:CAMPEP_0169125018 /NCGR_PEP_ID=MMETSP1015-20121227/34644_1 /TAXON_ID=342587 /ORGANISM="Karlodinium micrum, Strain CCMP2283" /LENGTH=98 /DNA_ID=CAMNT_0009188493 /DNA_START=73 /DNA_END=366 /DNA_ORIENTATION=+
MNQFQGSFPNENSNLWADAVYGGDYGRTQYPIYSDGMQSGSAVRPKTDDNLLRLASQEVRMGFIRKVYGILILMLLISLAVAMPFFLNGIVWDARHVW